ncbi:MAG: helicase-related protein, partial [Clostridia bacterium]
MWYTLRDDASTCWNILILDAMLSIGPDNNLEYNIIVTSDVLSEGINLHRSNVIVNYDTPWNATRLMQRIGRVNRI